MHDWVFSLNMCVRRAKSSYRSNSIHRIWPNGLTSDVAFRPAGLYLVCRVWCHACTVSLVIAVISLVCACGCIWLVLGIISYSLTQEVAIGHSDVLTWYWNVSHDILRDTTHVFGFIHITTVVQCTFIWKWIAWLCLRIHIYVTGWMWDPSLL